jgi:hypothetical protein
MMQSEYEHLYDHITLDNMHLMSELKQPKASVVIEDYVYCGFWWANNPRTNKWERRHSYKVYSAGGEGYYYAHEDHKALYTESHSLSVFRLP